MVFVRRELLVQELDGGIIDRGLESLAGPGSTAGIKDNSIVRSYGQYLGCTIQVCYSLKDDTQAAFWISGEEKATGNVAEKIRNLNLYCQSPEAIIFKEERVNQYPK